MQKKIKIAVDVPHGTCELSDNFQFERSKVKVTGREKPPKSGVMFTYGRQRLHMKRGRRWLRTRPTPLLGLLYCRRLIPWATGRTAAYYVGADISNCFIANLLSSTSVKELWMSVNIWWSYDEILVDNFLLSHPVELTPLTSQQQQQHLMPAFVHPVVSLEAAATSRRISPNLALHLVARDLNTKFGHKQKNNASPSQPLRTVERITGRCTPN